MQSSPASKQNEAKGLDKPTNSSGSDKPISLARALNWFPAELNELRQENMHFYINSASSRDAKIEPTEDLPVS
jgi:hypothetical protein